MLQQQVICDQCGVVKAKSNHWWIIYPNESGNGIILEPLEPFDPEDDSTLLEDKHLCSQRCVNLVTSEFMNKVSNAPMAKTESLDK